MNPMHESDTFERPGAFLFLAALHKAAARPVLWIATWAALFLLSLAPSMATHRFMERALGHGNADWRTLRETGIGPSAESWTKFENKRPGGGLSPESWTLSETFRQDHGAGLSQLDASNEVILAALSAVALLIGVFAAGGWLQLAFERVDGRQFRRFCFGGAAYFWRFLRVLVLVVLLLALVRWVCYGTPWKELVLHRVFDVPANDFGRLESLESELTVARLGWAQDGLAAFGFALVLVWAVYTRTRMVQRDSRSALTAGIASFFLLLRHPIQTLRPLCLLLLVEAAVVVWGAGALMDVVEARAFDRPRIEHVVALFGIVQGAALWRHLTSGAKYIAAARVSLYLVPPHRKKGNPWQTIGGPGGPQYPVGDSEDEYHVAL